MNRSEVFTLILEERARQAELWQEPHAHGLGDCSSPHVPQMVKAVVLAEEAGEVARAVLDGRADALRAELVQVAAVAVAWLEGMP